MWAPGGPADHPAHAAHLRDMLAAHGITRLAAREAHALMRARADLAPPEPIRELHPDWREFLGHVAA